MASAPSIYPAGTDPPEDLLRTIHLSDSKPPTPARPSFGLDSPGGLLASNVTAPLFLYASLRGKFRVWDDLLSGTPDALFRGPALDVGCGRGLVLLKVAQRKKLLAAGPAMAAPGPTRESAPPAAAVDRAVGIDIFAAADQTGNSPAATYRNAAALDLLDYVVLHAANFTEPFPFTDGAFSLVTASLSLHNTAKDGTAAAVKEMARHLGWAEVDLKGAGLRMMYGVLPSQILVATKPAN